METTSWTIQVGGFDTLGVEQNGSGWHIRIRSQSPEGMCPLCGHKSLKLHSNYERQVRDLAVADQPVVLTICARKFKCQNERCPRTIFCERLNDFVGVRGQRSHRLTTWYRAIGFVMSAEGGARLTVQLQIPTSGDTLIRIIRATPLTPKPDLSIIGVDDWAIKKSQRYGTLIVDHQSGRPVDVISGRGSQDLTKWLDGQAKVGIQIVTRDRSPEYIRALTESAPQALRVADRWHLLQNMREVMQRLLARHRDDVEQAGRDVTLSHTVSSLLEVAEKQTLPALTSLNPQFCRSAQARATTLTSRIRRQQRYEQVQVLKANGGTLSQIARVLDMSRVTVRKYFYAQTLPERKPNRRRKSQLDRFVPHLQARFDAGCRNASQLWREIGTQGFKGCLKQVHHWMHIRRDVPAPSTAKPFLQSTQEHVQAARTKLMDLPSTRQLAWMFVQPETTLTESQAGVLEHILRNPRLKRTYRWAQQFCTMVKSHAVEGLETWLTECTHSDLPDLVTFAAGIKADYAAVKNALTLSWSNARSEGHVNRIKMIKRVMFGRANFDLLRLRVLYYP